jgi:hypothetical protein
MNGGANRQFYRLQIQLAGAAPIGEDSLELML